MTVSEYPIAFAGAEDYTPGIIFPALTRAVEASGFTREMVAGRRVLLKPNLLMKRRPEEATTTHPPPGDPPVGLCRLRTLCRELSGAYHHHRKRQGADPVRPVHPLLLLP